MQQLQQSPMDESQSQARPQVKVLINNLSTSSHGWALCRKWGLGLATLALVGTATGAVYQRYGQSSLADMPLQTEAVDGHRWVGEDITFEQIQGHQFNVSFTLHQGGSPVELKLQDIDLSLVIPTVPTVAQESRSLTRWFLTEREFNRQRVVFEPGSTHIQLPAGLGDYAPEDISIAITNNCLGAGYWELAISAKTDTGSEKIYQGYFTFSR
ncbi:MAG: hypothetical protein AAFY17_16925, partial [Cyanobacteria bacterium J06642_11]